METNQGELPSRSQAREDLAAVAATQGAIGARIASPWWAWALLGGCIGVVFAARGLPPSWAPACGVISVLGCAGAVATMATTMAGMRRTGVRGRAWGGVAWLGVVLVVVAVLLAVALAHPVDPPAGGYAPRYFAIGLAVAAVYAGGGILADRLRVRHMVRRRP